MVASQLGASIGGLFLALPALFCASATLVEKHEVRRKREAGLVGERRGKNAAALEAAGAAMGSVGMLAFGLVFSSLVERDVSAAFIAASMTWVAVSVACWLLRRRMRSLRRSARAARPRDT